jgi:uncharacterized protein
MKHHSSTLVIGAPATGDKYWPRPGLSAELLSALENDHVIFPGPRRTGKTSVLKDLESRAADGEKVVLINTEKLASPAALIQTIAKAVAPAGKLKTIAKSIGGQASRIKSIKVAVFGLDFDKAAETDWQAAADALLNTLQEQTNRTLIMLDEFSVFVDLMARKDKAQAEQLLRWFREWRQRLVDTPVRFLLTGSIGIDSVLRKLQLGDTINDFRSIEMCVPSDAEAKKFLKQRAQENGIPLKTGHAAKIIELIGQPWFYFLNIFLAEIQAWSRREGCELTSKDLASIYQDRLVGPGNENVKHMWDKLDEIFAPAEQRLARELLRHMSRTANGMSRTEMENVHMQVFPPGSSAETAQLDYVLRVLRHDGYLIQSTTGEQRTYFTSNLLRDFWFRQHA